VAARRETPDTRLNEQPPLPRGSATCARPPYPTWRRCSPSESRTRSQRV